MAAGHCVLIPADGAYWDRTLKDGVDCIKYAADDTADLSVKLLALSRNMESIRKVGAAAARVAQGYRAEIRYAPIKEVMEGMTTRPEALTKLPSETGANP